jgi:hypothetical protein
MTDLTKLPGVWPNPASSLRGWMRWLLVVPPLMAASLIAADMPQFRDTTITSTLKMGYQIVVADLNLPFADQCARIELPGRPTHSMLSKHLWYGCKLDSRESPSRNRRRLLYRARPRSDDILWAWNNKRYRPRTIRLTRGPVGGGVGVVESGATPMSHGGRGVPLGWPPSRTLRAQRCRFQAGEFRRVGIPN